MSTSIWHSGFFRGREKQGVGELFKELVYVITGDGSYKSAG